MQDELTIAMSSLLAGLFLASNGNEIGFSTVANVVNEFSNRFNIDVVETDEDIDKLYLIVNFDINDIVLKYDLNSIIKINGKKITVYEYLYSLTDELVRNYFNIEEKKNSKKRN